MNRAERRKIAKRKVDHRDLRQLEYDASRKAIDYTVSRYSAAVALACRDKLGFGKIRTKRFMDQIREIFKSIDEDYLTLDDVIATVKEELDIDLS